MNDEIIFKKCDSKIFLTPCILDADDITSPEKEAYKELEEVVKEELSTNYDWNETLEDSGVPEEDIVGIDDNSLPEHSSEIADSGLPDDNNFEGSNSIPPTIPNQLFRSTKNVLKIIGWINEKIKPPNQTSLPNISPESGFEYQEDYFQGKVHSHIVLRFILILHINHKIMLWIQTSYIICRREFDIRYRRTCY